MLSKYGVGMQQEVPADAGKTGGASEVVGVDPLEQIRVALWPGEREAVVEAGAP